MKRRILSMLLAVAFCIGLLPGAALAAEKGTITEQYPALKNGTTYWFDLSSVNFPESSSPSDSLPDKTMHWVPFTYAGTVNAYVLNSSSSGVSNSSEEAAANQNSTYGSVYAHSLFIADQHLTSTSWNDLNSKNLIFGTTCENGGVSYTLRAPSVGSSAGTEENPETSPANNEYDSIKTKLQDFSNSVNVWGQDTNSASGMSSSRAYRDKDHALTTNGTADSSSGMYYRPVLELPSNASLKVVTVNLGGGKIGNTEGPVKVVVAASNSDYTPSSEGITPPSGKVFDKWTVDTENNTITAQWLDDPTITKHPESKTVTTGATAGFEVAAVGTSLAYQWQVSTDGTDWTDMDGATSDSYTTEATTTAMNGYQYKCVVTNGSGKTATSNAATLTVTETAPDTYTVTFNSNGGSAVDSQTIAEGGTVTRPANPTRDGYTFAGWFKDTAFTTAWNFESDTVTENTTLYAKWTENEKPVDPKPDPKPDDDDDDWSPPTYRPEIEDNEGGKVEISDKRPEKGDSVTVKPKPEDGYEVDKIIVTDKNGNEIEVEDNGDGTFTFTQPRGKVKIEVLFAKTEIELPFIDVWENDWFYDEVAYVYGEGIMTGVTENEFKPDSPLTRAMVWSILARMDGEDVTGGAVWYEKAQAWVVTNGISDGTRPNETVTREQLASMLYRYAQYRGEGFTGSWMFWLDYPDAAQISDWAYEALCWNTMNGILRGRTDGALDPKGQATRAEAAVMLMQFCETMDA